MGYEQKSPKAAVTPLEGRLHEVFSNRLPGSRIELHWTPRRARVTALVIWQGFEDMDQVERQRFLWDIIREDLNPVDQARLTAHLTVTPREVDMMREP